MNKKNFITLGLVIMYGLLSFFVFNKFVEIERALTIFIMPLLLIGMVLLGLIILIVVIIVAIAAKKNLMCYLCVPISVALIMLNIMIYLNPSSRRENFEEYLTVREEIVNAILEGDMKESGPGVIELPDMYEGVSDGNRLLLVDYNGKTGIYFYTFAGLLESSSGYIYFTDRLTKEECIRVDLVNIEHIQDNWYSCSTS